MVTEQRALESLSHYQQYWAAFIYLFILSVTLFSLLQKGIKRKQLWLALEELFSLYIVETSSPVSYCHFIALQHMGSKTRTATSCLQCAGAVTEVSQLLSASVWLIMVGCYQQVIYLFIYFLVCLFVSSAMSMHVLLKFCIQKGKYKFA